MTAQVEPELQDYEAVERVHGEVPENPSLAQYLEFFHRAQANKLVRAMIQEGLPPVSHAPDPKATGWARWPRPLR